MTMTEIKSASDEEMAYSAKGNSDGNNSGGSDGRNDCLGRFRVRCDDDSKNNSCILPLYCYWNYVSYSA